MVTFSKKKMENQVMKRIVGKHEDTKRVVLHGIIKSSFR